MFLITHIHIQARTVVAIAAASLYADAELTETCVFPFSASQSRIRCQRNSIQIRIPRAFAINLLTMKNGIYKITSDQHRTTPSSSLAASGGPVDPHSGGGGGGKERINYGATAGIAIHSEPSASTTTTTTTMKLPYPKSVIPLLGSMFFERIALNGMKSTDFEFNTTVTL